MNAYILLGIPALLVGIAWPPAFLFFLAIAVVLIIGALLLSGLSLKARVDELEAEAERRERETLAPVVVDATGDGGMDDLLLELLVSPSIPAQRTPGGWS